jgi:thiamine pyrophosphate-dependent acetolactate synthase large subunit-like protein
VDIDPREIGKNIPVAVGIVGDAKAVLADMLDALGSAQRRPSAAGWRDGLVGTYEGYLAGLEPMLGPPVGPMTQGRLAKEAGDYLADKKALFTIDGGSTLLWAFSYIRAFEPRQRFFFAGGGHLGTGQPIANALKLAQPERLVVNFCGDGGFGMTLPELDTAARHGLNVVNIINNDGGWGMCKAGQLFLYGGQACDRIDQDFVSVDYAAVARAFGCYGERVDVVEEVRPALERALSSGLPAVLDVKVQPVPHPMFGVMAAVVLQGCQMPAPAGGPPPM